MRTVNHSPRFAEGVNEATLEAILRSFDAEPIQRFIERDVSVQRVLSLADVHRPGVLVEMTDALDSGPRVRVIALPVNRRLRSRYRADITADLPEGFWWALVRANTLFDAKLNGPGINVRDPAAGFLCHAPTVVVEFWPSDRRQGRSADPEPRPARRAIQSLCDQNVAAPYAVALMLSAFQAFPECLRLKEAHSPNNAYAFIQNALRLCAVLNGDRINLVEVLNENYLFLQKSHSVDNVFSYKEKCLRAFLNSQLYKAHYGRRSNGPDRYFSLHWLKITQEEPGEVVGDFLITYPTDSTDPAPRGDAIVRLTWSPVKDAPHRLVSVALVDHEAPRSRRGLERSPDAVEPLLCPLAP
ncbi:MAG: hypothetical protein ACFB2Z_05510 [Maricaulaceae bacterium]